MNQFPQSPDVATQQPPVYHQDPNAQQPQFQQGQMYPQVQQQQQQQYPGSLPPLQGYASPPPQVNQEAFPIQDVKAQQHIQQPGMPPQQQSGTVYQNATPLANLNRSPAPADCPACGQRSMTNVAYETGNTTQYVCAAYPPARR